MRKEGESDQFGKIVEFVRVASKFNTLLTLLYVFSVPTQNFNETCGRTNDKTVVEYPYQGYYPKLHILRYAIQNNMISGGYDQRLQGNQFNQGPIVPFNVYNDSYPVYFNDNQVPRFPTPIPSIETCDTTQLPKAKKSKWRELFSK